MSEDDVFHKVSMVMNVDPAEIAKIVHDYIERGIGCDYDRLNCPKPPIYIGPVKVKTLKERLEEATMHADCEFCVKRDICTRDVPKPCKYRYTEEERIADQASDMFGNILHKTYLHPTFRKKKEDNKMKATSKQEIKNVMDISFSFVSCPIEMKSELTVTATTDDDIFEFVFEGEHIIQSCEKSGMFIDWEKDQRIRELEEQIKKLEQKNKAFKDTADTWSKEYYNLSKKFDKLQEENKKLQDGGYNVVLHGMDFTPEQLVDRIIELEELKTPTIENFEEPADNVNHPSHYTGRYECIDVMQDVFGDEATDNFCLCNAFKYIWRAHKKNGLEDVKKAVWYLTRYIEEAENGVQKGEQI